MKTCDFLALQCVVDGSRGAGPDRKFAGSAAGSEPGPWAMSTDAHLLTAEDRNPVIPDLREQDGQNEEVPSTKSSSEILIRHWAVCPKLLQKQRT